MAIVMQRVVSLVVLWWQDKQVDTNEPASGSCPLTDVVVVVSRVQF